MKSLHEISGFVILMLCCVILVIPRYASAENEVSIIKDINGLDMSAVEKVMSSSNPVAGRNMPVAKINQVAVEQDKPIDKTVTAAQGRNTVKKPSKRLQAADKKTETVTVLKGETLFKIAKRVYGRGSKYLTLYEANKDTISDPNLIIVGQVLKVPR